MMLCMPCTPRASLQKLIHPFHTLSYHQAPRMLLHLLFACPCTALMPSHILVQLRMSSNTIAWPHSALRTLCTPLHVLPCPAMLSHIPACLRTSWHTPTSARLRSLLAQNHMISHACTLSHILEHPFTLPHKLACLCRSLHALILPNGLTYPCTHSHAFKRSLYGLILPSHILAHHHRPFTFASPCMFSHTLSHPHTLHIFTRPHMPLQILACSCMTPHTLTCPAWHRTHRTSSHELNAFACPGIPPHILASLACPHKL